jgi:hypothetical protein
MAPDGEAPQNGRHGSEEAEAMRWRIFDEPLEMVERRFQYFPQRFQWRGQNYRVQQVRECWTVSRRGWRQRVERHFFCVECAEGAFELYQDVRENAWHLRRARLSSAPARWVQQTAPSW